MNERREETVVRYMALGVLALAAPIVAVVALPLMLLGWLVVRLCKAIGREEWVQ